MPPAYYPEHIDYARQGIETPGTRRDGQTGIWKGGIFDPADLKDSKEPQDLFRLLEDCDHLPALLKIAPHCPTLRVIVTMDAFPPSEWEIIQQWAQSINIKLYTFSDVEARGRADLLSPGPEPGEEDISKNRVVAISYTSGTTGDPKGVVITSSNLLYATLSIAAGYSDRLKGIHWKLLSFLPLGHIYERVLESVALYCGATIAFSQCDPAKFLEDAQFFKPHMLPGVPRMWNRISSAITDQMKAPGLKGALLRKAVATKIANWEETGQVTHTVYDALVFRKIKALAGGEVIFMTTGSAPLRPDVHALLKVCFCADFVQGFGMTETMSTGALKYRVSHVPSKPDLTTFVHSIPNDKTSLGTCGFLASCNEAKLVDVPDMNYHATDQPNPRGELCMRGYNVSPGYLHNEKATAEAIDNEGWFHTGDIGEFDACGRLKIIDRLKNVIKLSQGRVTLRKFEYVALEKLEGLYASNPLFASLLVHGDSTRSHLIALAVLDPEQASKLVWKVLEKGVRAEDVKQLEMAVKEKEVRKVVLRQLAKVAAKNGLNGFEMIKGLHLTVRPFPDEILTPTFKVKRNIAAKVFRDVIEEVYDRGEGEVKEPLAPLARVARG
ncbi:hypothetical protein B9479_003617 [Cryptococcus floricola]|uniref:AMP-dependent synthetase/ligase domain-containing protein n=1 Tax=Cryptococcus floricola TaxID=2591691 RepID=A0A5D3B088_9TREE|nr:hypothetical protein B9479_003617 [Cryptococcus floricola]